MDSNNSIECIIEKYQRDIFGYCFRMVRDFHAAQDIAQEVFIGYYKRFGTIDSARYLPAYLYRIAYHKCTDFLRKKGRLIFSALDEEIMDYKADLEESLLSTQYSFSVEEGLNSLTPLQRSILILHSVEGMTHSEIAEILKKSEAAVRKQYQRARESIEARLTGKGRTGNEEDKVFSGF